MNSQARIVQQVSYTNAKKTSRAIRAWIEGSNNTKAGFVVGAPYGIEYNESSIVLTLDPNGPRKVTNSARNGKDRPIIDLHSKDVAKVFNADDRIKVTFCFGRIVLSLHHEDTNQEARETRLKENAKLGK